MAQQLAVCTVAFCLESVHVAGVQTQTYKPSSISNQVNDQVVIMDAMTVGMLKAKCMNDSNELLTNSLVRSTNVGSTLPHNFKNSLVETRSLFKPKCMNDDNVLLTNSLVRETNVGSTPSNNFKNSLVETSSRPSQMYTQIFVNGMHVSDASSAMQRWTPKPVKQKSIKPESMDLWCDRLGGASESSLNALAKDANSAIKLSTSKLSEIKLMQQSKANMKAKSHSGQMPRVMVPGHKWYGDSSGPHVKSFLFHYQYEFGWVCDATNLLKVFFAKTRKEADEIFLKLCAWSPHTVKIVVVDGAKEYFSGSIKQHV